MVFVVFVDCAKATRQAYCSLWRGCKREHFTEFLWNSIRLYVVDQSTAKQGMYLPGTHLPVLAPEHIFQDRPDFLLILPWNLQTEIIDLMSNIRDWGAKFIIPIPSATILD